MIVAPINRLSIIPGKTHPGSMAPGTAVPDRTRGLTTLVALGTVMTGSAVPLVRLAVTR